MRRLTDRLSEARRNQSGFTLIELLIVIVILGILAAIVVFSVRGITDRGKVSACKSDVATVSTAVEAYYAQEGTWAADIATLVSKGLIHADPGDVTYTPGTSTTNAVIKGAAGSDCAGYTV